MKAALVVLAVAIQVSGIVVKQGADSLQPLSNARVELLDGPTHEIVRTDEAGRFVFDAVQPGSYRVLASRDGFVRQEFGQRTPGGPPSHIDVTAMKPVDDIVFLMQPAPTISGWVRDEFGEIATGVRVEAFRQGYDVRGKRTLTPIASTLSDDHGQYRLYWLDPGDYVVRASSADSDSVYLPTYYPGFDDPAVAETVHLKNGEVDGVDFKLSHGATTSIDGSLVRSDGGFSGGSVILQPPGNIASSNRYSAEANGVRGRLEGSFSIDKVTPGDYIASATQTIGGRRYSGHANVVIRNTPGRPYHLRLEIAPNIDVKGSVRADSGGPLVLAKAQIQLRSIEPVLPSPPPVAIARDGSFSIGDVGPGEYAVEISGLPADAYKDAYIKDAPDVLDVEPGVLPKALSIVLGSQGGALTGTVRDASGQVRFGAQVVLVPDGGRQDRPNQYRIAATEPNGRFELRGIPPGDYKAYAWEVIEPNAHFNTDVVKKFELFGVPIHIAAGQKHSLDLQMIPAE